MVSEAITGALDSTRGEWRRVSRYVSRRGAREFAREVGEAFLANDLLTYASAISYQVVYAVIPAALALLALLGFLELAEIWSRQIAPQLEERLSQAAYTLVNDTVERILGQGRGFWLTAGTLIGLWQISGAVRAASGALNRVYQVDENRSFVRRMAVSLALAAAVAACVTVALVLFHLAPHLAELVGVPRAVGLAVRWLPAAVLLLLAVTLLTRYAPAKDQSGPWMSLVALAIVAAWLVTSVVFAFWVVRFGSYQNVYGSLAAVILALTYVYLSAVVFLAGVQIDALVRTGKGDGGK